MTTEKLTRTLDALEVEVRRIGKYRMDREGFYRGTLRFAFIRSFEFCRCVCGSDIRQGQHFYMAAGLRGICEDYITLKYLSRLNRGERDAAVHYKMLLATAEASEKQVAFFAAYRPFQPVLPAWSREKVTELKAKLTALGAASGLWKTQGKLPPVEQMAAKVALKRFYDYVYALTSEVVHFNARIAFRSAWGKIDDTGEIQAADITTSNFDQYYRGFCQVYGVDLFIRIARTFRRALNLSPKFLQGVDTLRKEIDLPLRWPEAVTFEEMNQPVPFPLASLVVRVALESASQKERRRMLQRWRREKSETLNQKVDDGTQWLAR